MEDLAQELGLWSSRVYLVLGVAYAVTIAAGFLANRNLKGPVKDPHLAVAEVLILVMAPVMVALSVAIHSTAPTDRRPYTLVSLGWMVAAAATTSVVHFVELTVARRLDHVTFPGYDRLFGFQWPSTLYAVDIVRLGCLLRAVSPFRCPSLRSQHGRPGGTCCERGALAHRAHWSRNGSHRVARHRNLRIRGRLPRELFLSESLSHYFDTLR